MDCADVLSQIYVRRSATLLAVQIFWSVQRADKFRRTDSRMKTSNMVKVIDLARSDNYSKATRRLTSDDICA
ncbi:hypothetical protein GJ496_000135 [Pomphorhynchus laevis]|nr:hypothetical protein GJ496_000135 [Pomphorhynchus laevis]